ncbi:MAG: hypothetical protein ACRDSH_20265, partial [Pseudonocardiaceae bacterium]
MARRSLVLGALGALSSPRGHAQSESVAQRLRAAGLAVRTVPVPPGDPRDAACVALRAALV